MNQQCKVCGEPAAGFHFGAFTCEGCKSFFGRSYNNLGSISECKNQGECVINKKNRTSCKACRLRKCLLVGMSKSGSRYGRRSNWFKIHCLLQEQGRETLQSASPHFDPRLLAALARGKEELILLGLDDCKTHSSPSVSSPESHNSDSSVEVNDSRVKQPTATLYRHLKEPANPFLPFPSLVPLHPAFLPPAFFATHNYLIPKTSAFHSPQQHFEDDKRFYLDAILQSQRSPASRDSASPPASTLDQDSPMDLTVKSPRLSSCSSEDEDITVDGEDNVDILQEPICRRTTPLDLTTKI